MSEKLKPWRFCGKDGASLRGQTTEELKTMLKTPSLTMKHWLIKEILQEREKVNEN